MRATSKNARFFVDASGTRRRTARVRLTSLLSISSTLIIFGSCLVAFLLFSPFVKAAEISPYPEKLLDKEGEPVDFSGLEGLQDVYLNLYRDTNNEDNTLILNRVKEHQRAPEQSLLQEINTYCDLGVPEISYLADFSRRKQTDTSLYLRDLCDYERSLLRFQDQLARKNWMRAMFANDREDDSPFDIIADWDQIDGMFFGEKWEEQNPGVPKFARYDEQSMQEFSDVLEPWQDQSKFGIFRNDLSSVDFGEKDFSITGNLAKIKDPLQELNSRPLVGAIATTHFMQFGGAAVTPGTANGMGVFPASVPLPDASLPESVAIQNESIVGKFSGFVTRLLQTSECLDIQNTGEGRAMDDLDTLISCGFSREDVFADRIRERAENVETESEDMHRQKTLTALSMWNGHLESFLEQAKEWRSVAEELLTKQKD